MIIQVEVKHMCAEIICLLTCPVQKKCLQPVLINILYTPQVEVVAENFPEDEEDIVTDSACQSHLIGKNNVERFILLVLRAPKATIQQRDECTEVLWVTVKEHGEVVSQ